MNEKETIGIIKDFFEPRFICQHLLENPYLHINVPGNIYTDHEAWCDKCEEILHEKGEWTEEVEDFISLERYCLYCFEELRSRKIISLNNKSQHENKTH